MNPGSKKMTSPPLVKEKWSDLRELISGSRIVLFLDFDGTLTSVHDRPELAQLSRSMRSRLFRLASSVTVAIVSGRDRHDVAEKVGLENLTYAGCHGFDIEDPNLPPVPKFAHYVTAGEVKGFGEAIRDAVGSVSGTIVKVKTWAVAVHYREVAPGNIDHLESSIMKLVDSCSKFRARKGKKVIEVTPDVDWDKGRAVAWLLNIFEERDGPALPIYIGDDITDEDAFRTLSGLGITILVSGRDKETEASFRAKDPEEVGWFLDRVLKLLETR